jgi:hypothetical protein
MFKKFTQILQSSNKKRKKLIALFKGISKRQKFIVSVIVLSLILFSSERIFGREGIYIAVSVSVLTDVLILWAIKNDLKNNASFQVFILPFFYSLASSLFYFLIPESLMVRVGATLLYAFGLYSLLLSENIFVVSSIRTIALLSSARTVSFIVTILAYFFLANVVFSLHTNIFLTLLLTFLFSFPLIAHSIWTHTLDQDFRPYLYWMLLISLCLVEVSLILWFWSTSPTLIGLFLTCLFYIFVGLSQIWLDRRLFKSIMWEYIWVAVIVFIVFITFSLRS